MSRQNYGQNDGQGGRYGQFNPYAQQNDQYETAGAYGGQQQAGYGQQAGYDQQQPAYGQQQGAYGQQGAYDQQQPGYGQAQGGHGGQQTGVAARPEAQTYPSHNYPDEQANSAYEMNAMNGQTVQRKDPNAILNECREVNRGVDEIGRNINELRRLYRKTASLTTDVELRLHRETIKGVQDNTMDLYRNLIARMKRVISNPESGNPRNEKQVGATDRRLKTAINDYQKGEAEHRSLEKEQTQREFLTINPDATEAELEAASEASSGVNLFQQALLQQGRRGNAQNILSAVQARNEEIQKIERDLIELAQLFQDLDATVIQQEAAVQNIEQQGEQVEENVAKANVEIGGAINSARAARRKKFWCLGIAILIVIIIIVVVVVVVLVLQRQNSTPTPAPAAAPAPTATTAARIRMVRGQELDPVKS